QTMETNQTTLIDHLTKQSESIAGVSLDEEVANMVKFQHGYDAAARVITTMDEMIDVIINRMGVVGR
ncbi:MAG: flagellar basal body rod C-terminal domain-containing protein, partial [Syntrophothermus sp.]